MQTWFVSDPLTHAPMYTCTQTITFSLGSRVLNSYDNIVNEDDEIILYVEGFVSNSGSGMTNQVIPITHTILYMQLHVHIHVLIVLAIGHYRSIGK